MKREDSWMPMGNRRQSGLCASPARSRSKGVSNPAHKKKVPRVRTRSKGKMERMPKGETWDERKKNYKNCNAFDKRKNGEIRQKRKSKK